LTARRRARLCSEEGLGELSGEVTGHTAVDDIGEVALEDPAGFLLVCPRARALAKIAWARGSQRSWVIAMRCRTALMRRLPPGL